MARNMGAMMVKREQQKEATKQRAKAAAQSKDRAIATNNSEFIDRDRQRFDVTKAI